MPKLAPSGVKGLYKTHDRKCKVRKVPKDCDCSWKGKYKDANEVLAIWAGHEVDPRDQDAAEVVFNRLKASVDAKKFDDRGEQQSLGSDELFSKLITDYIKDYVEKRGLNSKGLASKSQLDTLNVIKTEKRADVVLGEMTLAWIVGNPTRIGQWLDDLAEAREIGPKTWNDYHQRLNHVCVWGMKQIVNGIPKMSKNPMVNVPRRETRDYTEVSPDAVTNGRIPKDIEARLFKACDVLNAPRASQARKLTQAKADAIREACANGAEQQKVAKKFKVSGSTVSDIVNERIWMGKAHRQTANKGDEMRRRLIGSIDGGMRVQELMKADLGMVDFVGVMVGGKKVLPIKLPPRVSKGGKFTKKVEWVYATTKRFIDMLEARREQLNKNPKAFIFGTESGSYQKGFARQYENLFEAAGLVKGRDYGRDLSFTFHTTRHEYASTVSELNNGNVKQTMALTRIKDAKTAKRYTHEHELDVLQAAVNSAGDK